MLNQLLNTPPLLVEDKHHFPNVIRQTLLLAIVFNFVGVIFLIFLNSQEFIIYSLLSIFTLVELQLYFITSKFPKTIGGGLLVAAWLSVTLATFTFGLTTNFVYLSIYLLIIIITLLLFGGKSAAGCFIATILNSLLHITANLLNVNLLFLAANDSLVTEKTSDFLLYFLYILLLFLTLRIIILIIQQATQYAAEVTQMNQELETIRASLSKEVTATTGELRQNESRYKILLETIPDVIIRMDRNGIYKDFYLPKAIQDNMETKNITRIGQSLDDIFPPALAKELLDIIHSVLDSGNPITHEYIHPLYGFHLELRIVKASDDEAISLVRDITERKRAEIGLREGEDRNRALLEALPDIMIRFDKRGQCLDFQVPKRSLISYNIQIGQSLHDIFSSETAVLIQHHINLALKTNGLQTFEYERSNKTQFFEIRMVASGEEEITAVIRDITHNKAAANQKQEEVKRLQQIITAIPGSVFILSQNPSDFVLWLNQEASQKFGIRTNQISGAHFSLINYLQNPVEFDQIMYQYESKGELKAFITRFKQQDNGYFWGRLSITDMMYDQQKANLMIIENINDLKVAEEAFQQAQKMQSLGILAGGIAHDFNNLLSGILAQGSVALAKLSPDHPVRSHIEKSIKTAEWAANLTQQMLAYSGRGQFDIRNININELLQENIELLTASLPKSTHLSTQFDSSLPLIEVDTNQLQQIIMNLLINATQAINKQSQSTISIITSREFLSEEDKAYAKYTGVILPSGEYVAVTVTDNGVGMDEETVKQVFDPFFTTKEDGRGLGLSAVLGIMKGHKGGVAVESQVGSGTMIKLLFPASKHLQMPFMDVQSEQQGQGEPPTGLVLMIDDEEVLREAVVDILEWEEIGIITAVNGREGIALYQKHMDEVSLVLLDLSMPGMSGEETLHALRQINQQVKVIICSGYSEQEVSHLFKDKDVTGFLAKPFQLAKLVDTLRQYM